MAIRAVLTSRGLGTLGRSGNFWDGDHAWLGSHRTERAGKGLLWLVSSTVDAHAVDQREDEKERRRALHAINFQAL